MDESVARVDNLITLSQRLFSLPRTDEKLDRMYYMLLIEDFSDLEIEDQMKQYFAWMLDNQTSQKHNFRGTFRKWLKRAVEYEG